LIILQDLPSLQCQISRDRIHCLLTLTAEGPDIQVDNGESDINFFYNVMKGLHELGLLLFGRTPRKSTGPPVQGFGELNLET
jgi:hypothetical protein